MWALEQGVPEEVLNALQPLFEPISEFLAVARTIEEQMGDEGESMSEEHHRHLREAYAHPMLRKYYREAYLQKVSDDL